MSPEFDELYLTWLYREVANPDIANPSQTYWKLVNYLFRKEFLWLVPNDENRSEDGKFLRYEFLEDLGLEEADCDPDWLFLECSVLEMLIALSRRLSFQAEGEPRDWFWVLIKHLGIKHNDRKPFPVSIVEEVLNRLIWRTYDPDGRGGLFPLEFPTKDQRDAEIWHQLNSYLLEREN